MFILDWIVWSILGVIIKIQELFCKHKYEDRIKVTSTEPPKEYKQCIKCLKEVH